MRNYIPLFLRVSACVVGLLALSSGGTRPGTLPGYVVHFDFISNVQEGRDLVRLAVKGGARVINVVPPGRIWDNPDAVRILDGILDEISRRKLSFVFARIDGAYPPDKSGERFNYLFGRILTERGRLPDGRPTQSYFLTTAGRAGYAEWMEDETRYYATHYGKLPNLLGINLGPFSEPFSSQRGGFLEYMGSTQNYEITQYTPEGEALWHRWLDLHFQNVAVLNREYGTAFDLASQVPMPLSESDTRFGNPEVAYFDFARCLNDWFIERYERCRKIWHETSGRGDVPLILQFSTGLADKFILGRPSFAAFDLADWIVRADAVGLSLYSNNGYMDLGHASAKATVNLVGLARDLGKDVFVLEGGYEAPNVVLDPKELAFFGSVAEKLDPRTYIYEFLKDKFDEDFASNPGKPVRADGTIRKPAYEALKRLFSEIERRPPSLPDEPVLYAISPSTAARGNLRRGAIFNALLDLGSDLPIRFLTPRVESIVRPGIPVVQADGSVIPRGLELEHLLAAVPGPDSPKRPAWRKSVAEELQRLAADRRAAKGTTN